jgi:SAM-dependent methyltransferase
MNRRQQPLLTSRLDPQRLLAWESKYQQGQTGWDLGVPSRALDHWLEQMDRGRVLVPGCGHGHEIAVLARTGHRVTAVDIAPTPVGRLRAELERQGLEAEVLQADLLHWEPEQPFDAVYEQTCLCALDTGHWQDYEQRLHRWLRPGGRLYALFMQTGRSGGPPYHCDPADMRELFAKGRWGWPEVEALELPRPNGNRELGWVLERL